MLDSAVSVENRRIWGVRPASGGFARRRKLARRPQDRERRAGAFSPAPPRERRAEVSSPALPRDRLAEASPPALPRERRAEASSPASPGERRAEAFAPAPLYLGYTATPNSPEFLQNSCFIYEKRKCSFTFKIEISLVITIEKSISKRNHEMISQSLRSCW